MFITDFGNHGYVQHFSLQPVAVQHTTWSQAKARYRLNRPPGSTLR